ncbi:hypothetical protein TIFTF001_015730 [Ficus carica]|uniref:Uncharacterized protein n=1 Tax=Ficus carica TaxID=3494 RepID=A0AA88AI92_FICCA|nr:hypothetical protein TIFTF001_015730 [Ficus carica]
MSNKQILPLMPKIYSTTPDMIAWSDRSCTVTLRRVTYKREAPRSDGDTGGVSATRTSMLKSMRAFPASSGVRVTRSGRTPSAPGGHASADTGGGHRVSLTRRRRPALGAKAGVRTGPVAARAKYSSDPGSVARSGVAAPKVISSWSAKGRSSTPKVVVVQHSSRGRVNIGPTRWWSFSIVPGEGFSSCRESFAWVNIGPTRWWLQHSSRGGFTLVRDTRLLALLQ